MMFAFHHFDTNNSGFITAENLKECFKREGKHLSDDEVDMMVAEVNPQIPGQVSLEEFETYMKTCLAAEPGSALATSPFLVAAGFGSVP
jgi:Ca2+-binding EF-hand superfamily protein